MDCPRPIKSVVPHVVAANQVFHENTKVRGPGVEAKGMHALNRDYEGHAIN